MRIFLTGATGFVGAHLIPRLLEQDPDTHIEVLIRHGSGPAPQERLTHLLADISTRSTVPLEVLSARVSPVPGDLTQPDLGLDQRAYDALCRRSDRIIHSAASVSLERPLAQSRQINVGGTRTLIKLAERTLELGGLSHYSHISTAYVAGKRKGLIQPTELDEGQRHNNPYERSKMEAEGVVREAMGRLPITVFRPSMIMGDSKTGYTSAFNVLYGPIKLGYFGKLPVVPASETSKIDAVPIDYVVDAIAHLSGLGEAVVGRTFHLSVGAGREISAVGLLGGAVEHLVRVVDELGLKNPRRIPRPMPPWLFKLACHLVATLAWGNTRRVFKKFRTYVNYTLYHKQFDNSDAARLLSPEGIAAPRLEDYLPVLCRYAVHTHFGRADGPRDVL